MDALEVKKSVAAQSSLNLWILLIPQPLPILPPWLNSASAATLSALPIPALRGLTWI